MSLSSVLAKLPPAAARDCMLAIRAAAARHGAARVQAASTKTSSPLTSSTKFPSSLTPSEMSVRDFFTSNAAARRQSSSYSSMAQQVIGEHASVTSVPKQITHAMRTAQAWNQAGRIS